jgi:hypothetical protein
MNILYVYADLPHEWNCSQHNCINPANAFNAHSEHTANVMRMADFIKNDETAQSIINSADIILL